jgi:hypothetical protein
MKFRMVRKTFSATCAVICLLLIGLWLRSYWWEDEVVVYASSQRFVGLGTAPGAIQIATGAKSHLAPWTHVVESHEKVLRQFANMGISYPSGFWGRFYVGSGVILVPLWFLILLIVSLAAPPTQKIIWRFSLRMALLAVTLIAGVLALSSGMH